MNSDSEEDMMVDDWLSSKQDLSDTSDEELNDDLLCSDEEKETIRYHDESISQPKMQAIAKPLLVCRTLYLAEDQATICGKEEQTGIEVDTGEVLDIEINAPSGDEFQSGADLHHMHSSCRRQPTPEKTLTGPCRPEPRFPGQHMLDQQHPASVLDTNPLFAGQTPKGFLQPPGYESDPWRPSPALQAPTSPSKSGRPQPALYPLRNYLSPRTDAHFKNLSGPRAQKPAVLVRAVARKESSAKPVAVARGMPIAAKQTASAKSTISAKTPPAQGTVGRNAGQKVKEEPQTPPALQKLPVKQLNINNNDECADDGELYRQRLMEQTKLRKEILEQKEHRRRMQAINKNHQLPKRLRRDFQACWKNNQHQQKPYSHVKQTNQRSCFPNLTPLPCSLQNCRSECQPVPQQHQHHILMARSRASSYMMEKMQENCPHQLNTDNVVFPDHRNLQCITGWASHQQEAGKIRLETGNSDTYVPTRIRVVYHFNTGIHDELRTVPEKEPRVVTFTTPDSFLQHSTRQLCTDHIRVSIPNQCHHKVLVGENQCCAFIPLSSCRRTESVAAQSDVNFIVRLNH